MLFQVYLAVARLPSLSLAVLESVSVLLFFGQEAIALREVLPLLRGDEGDTDAEERGSYSSGGQGYPHAFR